MPAPYYVSTGAWGSGLGRPLHVAEFDGNTYNISTRLTALEGVVGGPIYPTNVTAVGSLLTFWFSNSTSFAVGMPLALAAPAPVRTITFVSSAYTLIADDANAYLRSTASDTATITFPADADVPFGINTEVHIRQGGAGAITLLPATGVTLNAAYGCTNVTIGQGATVTVKKVATNVWDVVGGQLVAA